MSSIALIDACRYEQFLETASVLQQSDQRLRDRRRFRSKLRYASSGATGSSYDNALADTINGLDQTELIEPRGPWRTVERVEIDMVAGV